MRCAPPGLLDSLATLSGSLGGALAIVSGRSLADLDRLLAPMRPAVAAEHGAVLRLADGRMHFAEPPTCAMHFTPARSWLARIPR